MDERGHISAARLGAYHDGELSPPDAADVTAHTASCDACRARLEQLDRLERLTSALPEPQPASDLWPGIQAAFASHDTPGASSPWRSPAWRYAAAAAVIAILIGGLAVLGPPKGIFQTPVQTAELFGFDYGPFLTGLNEPAKMAQFERTYRRREVSIEEALSMADMPVDRDLLERIPAGLDLKAVYVLSTQAARAVQISYGHNGSEISVFRQPEGLPVRFAGYRIEAAAVGSTKCLMVDTGRYCAITFSSRDAQYVVIGRNDDMEVARVIDELVASL